jgi:hypothetical protein
MTEEHIQQTLKYVEELLRTPGCDVEMYRDVRPGDDYDTVDRYVVGPHINVRIKAFRPGKNPTEAARWLEEDRQHQLYVWRMKDVVADADHDPETCQHCQGDRWLAEINRAKAAGE